MIQRREPRPPRTTGPTSMRRWLTQRTVVSAFWPSLDRSTGRHPRPWCRRHPSGLPSSRRSCSGTTPCGSPQASAAWSSSRGTNRSRTGKAPPRNGQHRFSCLRIRPSRLLILRCSSTWQPWIGRLAAKHGGTGSRARWQVRTSSTCPDTTTTPTARPRGPVRSAHGWQARASTTLQCGAASLAPRWHRPCRSTMRRTSASCSPSSRLF